MIAGLCDIEERHRPARIGNREGRRGGLSAALGSWANPGADLCGCVRDVARQKPEQQEMEGK